MDRASINTGLALAHNHARAMRAGQVERVGSARALATAAVLAVAWCAAAPARMLAEEVELKEGETRIFLANADGSEMKLLTNQLDWEVQGSPTWSPDGKQIAFDGRVSSEPGGDVQIAVVDADGSNPRIVSNGAMPSFSPEGRRIAFSRYSPHGVWVMSSKGPDEELFLLDKQGWGAEWSPDGRHIAYTAYTDGGANIVVYDVIEGVRRYLFEKGREPYAMIYWNFTWSPDSRRIVFRADEQDGTSEVAIVDARGQEHGLSTRLVQKASSYLAWSPDGASILFNRPCAERQGLVQLYAMDPYTKAVPQLLPAQNADLNHQAAAYSPDGKRLAISSRNVTAAQAQARRQFQ